MKNIIEIFITFVLVALAIIVMVNLMIGVTDKQEIKRCKEHVQLSEKYPDYFISDADRIACEFYQVDITGVKVIAK